MFKNTNLFTIITKILVAILPFYVLIKVFFDAKLWFWAFWFFIKEWLLLLLLLLLILEHLKKKIIPKFDLIDYLIIFYFIYWIWISILNWISLNWIISWWRYDFIFLFTFLIFKHSKIILKASVSELLKIFLISWAINLAIWVFIKFIIWEEVLQIFWYSIYVADWYFKWWIPIYHWVEASWIRRFQWMLDSPNAMAFFIIVYWWLFLHYFRKKLDFFVVISSIILFTLLIITYSRSALLWVIFWTLMLTMFNLSKIFKRYKKESIFAIIFLSIFSLSFYFSFEQKINNIFIRSWSTKWHFERMDIWINRFLENPMWQWLSTAGPWFRSLYDWVVTKKEEAFYIPESWFIQQLIEWWIIYFLLFISIFFLILKNIYKNNIFIFWMILAILVMNWLLHVFEATYISILLFIFIWLLYNKEKKKI